jgi:hypothetical protein
VSGEFFAPSVKTTLRGERREKSRSAIGEEETSTGKTVPRSRFGLGIALDFDSIFGFDIALVATPTQPPDFSVSYKLGRAGYLCISSLSENRLKRGGQAHFAASTPQNEPVPDGIQIGTIAR